MWDLDRGAAAIISIIILSIAIIILIVSLSLSVFLSLPLKVKHMPLGKRCIRSFVSLKLHHTLYTKDTALSALSS